MDSGALYSEATKLWARGDPSGAERLLLQVVALAPKHAQALNALGNIALFSRRLDLAVERHQRAVKAAPRDPAFRNDLANAIIQSGQPQLAVAHLEKALTMAPGFKPIVLNLVRAHRDLGAADKALALLDRLAQPDDPDVALERGLILAQTGDAEGARALFRTVLVARPDDHRAINGLATCHRATLDDNDIAIARSALTPRLSASKRSVVHRSLGKMYEDIGSNDEAYAQFEAANKSAGGTFDIAAHAKFIDDTIAQYTPAFFAERARAGAPSDKPVFIVGMPRSGTTLVEQILASHPDVVALGELVEIEEGIRATVELLPGMPGNAECVAALERPAIRQAGQRYLNALEARGARKARAVDKLPHNFLMLGWIRLILPNARIIHCRRDPLDICISCFTHRFSDAHAYSTDLSMLGAYYKSYERLMLHWAAALPDPPLDVSYEALVADPEGESRRMTAFLGLEWTPECLSFHQTRRVVQTPSQWQVRQPMYHSSIGRWRKFERHLAPLIAALR